MTDTVVTVPTITAFIGKFRFLSNFYPCRVNFAGLDFPSSENAFQAMKCADKRARERFLTLTAVESKREGHLVANRIDWESVKVQVMSEVLHAKFAQSTELRQKLLETIGSVLVEGNTWGDFVWGVCQGKGENKLGKLLMCERTYWHLWMTMKKLDGIPYGQEVGQQAVTRPAGVPSGGAN